jgi:hypothetical protein
MTATAKAEHFKEALKKIQRMNRNGLKAQAMRGDRNGSDLLKIVMKFSDKLDAEVNQALAVK